MDKICSCIPNKNLVKFKVFFSLNEIKIRNKYNLRTLALISFYPPLIWVR